MSTDDKNPPRSWRSSRIVLAGTVLGAAAGIAGIAAAQNGDSGPPEPPPWASTASDSPLQFSGDRQDEGPGLSADQAIAQTLNDLGDSSVTSANVINAPADSGETGRWLSVEIDSDQGDAGVKQRWLARLIQGAVDDLMRTNETTTSDVLDGAQLVDHDSSGKQVITYLGHGGVLGGQVFSSPSDDVLRQQVTDAADKFGLTVQSIQALHPLDTALVVTMDVPDGPVDWNISKLEEAIEGSPPNIEGLYLELDSPAGEPLVQKGFSFRTPGGDMWFAPGQDDRFGISHG
jgi:hypothetical protein